MITIRKFNNISDVIYSSLPESKYRFSDTASEYDAALVRSADLHEEPFPSSLIAIARAGAGVNNIPLDRCSGAGIVVFNTPGANANAVKELVICGMMLAGRRIITGAEWVERQKELGAAEDVAKSMEKAKKNFVGREIAGKKLGVIGLGAIGVMVANAAVALDMEVYGYDPYLSVNAALKLSRSVTVVEDQNELLKICDFVSLHVPLTDQTRNTIDYNAISLMKHDAVLLNLARGGLVDNKAVVRALDEGRLGRYVTDFPDEDVIGNPNVIATPHLGASTPEAEENCARMAAKQLRDYIEDGNIRNSVNFPESYMPRTGGYRICIINENIANMIGQISSVIASAGHNVEHMLNRSRGPWAYTVIDVLSRPSGELLSKLRAIQGVVRVRVIEP